MRIFIRKGKGDRDRFALLPQTTLDTLRLYWKSCRPKPKEWLFISPRTGEQVTVKLLQDAFKKAVKRAGI
jgi:integrase